MRDTKLSLINNSKTKKKSLLCYLLGLTGRTIDDLIIECDSNHFEGKSEVFKISESCFIVTERYH
jgi:hypothetical protein